MMDRQRQAKREQFETGRKNNRWSKILFFAGLLLSIGVAGWFVLSPTSSTGFAEVKSVNGEVRLDLTQISDGQAHYYRYAAGQGEITFFVIKSVDGVLRAAFDACDVCYREKKGYRQEGEMMVCNNCDMKFRSDLINLVKGGCNPAPLNRRIEGGQLVIHDRDLLQGAWYFGS